MKGMNTVE